MKEQGTSMASPSGPSSLWEGPEAELGMGGDQVSGTLEKEIFSYVWLKSLRDKGEVGVVM